MPWKVSHTAAGTSPVTRTRPGWRRRSGTLLYPVETSFTDSCDSSAPTHRGSEAPRLDNQSLDACSQDFAVKVEQQAHGNLQHPHVGEHLCLMNSNQPFHALDFADDPTFYDEIWPIFTYHASFVKDRDSDLSCERQAFVVQLETQGFFIRRFHQAWPKCLVNGDGASNDAFRESVMHVHLGASVPRCVVSGESERRVSQ